MEALLKVVEESKQSRKILGIINFTFITLILKNDLKSFLGI